jgi:hypothetical protein
LRPALRDMLALLALTGAVWLVHLYGRRWSTAVIVLVWAALTGLTAFALLRRARIRRAAFLAAYVHTGSPLARLFRGGWLMAARMFVIGAGLALLLGIALLRLEPAEWLVLLGAVPLVVLAHTAATHALAPHTSSVFLAELVWRITIPAAGSVLVAALVALNFHRAYPALGGVSLEQAVWHFVDAEHARSAAVEVLLQLAAAIDGLRLWLAQQLMPAPGSSLAQAFGWLLLLAEQCLFVWSYLLPCSAVLMATSAMGTKQA